MNAYFEAFETVEPVARPLAYFISAHGFGHAARACAVMEALHTLNGNYHFHLFTQVPAWFFQTSLSAPFTYHAAPTDVGVAQHSALAEDLPTTLEQLAAFYPLDPPLVQTWSDWLGRLACELVVCDIAPLGIAVAQRLGVPAVLIENFTWDWIYEGYVAQAPNLKPYSTALRALFAQADYHLQVTPVCQPQANATLTTAPLSRRPRQTRAATRQQLGLPTQTPLILITMGGLTPAQYTFLDQLRAHPQYHFLLPGASATFEQRDNLLLLPPHSDFFHPDLVQAADGVVGKVGYSTLAEVYHAGCAYGYVPRPHFRESPALVSFIQAHMRGLEISAEAFAGGAWLAELPKLLASPQRGPTTEPNGAVQAAEFIATVLHS